jgi:Ca2+-binding RTX toxin-like protein
MEVLMAKGNKGGNQGLQLIGTVGDDHLVGDAGNDVIDGGLGFDVIDFSGSSKSVKVNLAAGTASGQGNDTLVSIEDVIGSKRSDSLIGDGFGNILDGGNGNDHLVGNGGDDFLIGGAGNDHLTASSGFDLLDGGAGNDHLAAGDGDNDIFAGAGNDKIVAGSGFDFIDAGDGNDNISSGAGDDEVYAGAGNDKVTGGEGNDWIDGGAGKDNMIGGAGDDTYYVEDAQDKVREMVGEGNDTIVTNSSYSLAKLGNVENLTLDGSANINATGNSADNVLTGNSGDNVLDGQAGNDILIGREGDDTLIGGTGNDIFVFDNLDGVDRVQDFTIGSDLLGLDADVFTALAAGVLDANLVMGTAAVDADDFLIFDATSGALSYDADANGIGAAVQIATVGVPSLAAADFVVA